MRPHLNSSSARASRARRGRSPPDATMRPARSSGTWTVNSMHFYATSSYGPGQEDGGPLQVYRAARGGIAAEVRVVRQTSHHRTHFYEALSSLRYSLRGWKMGGRFKQARGVVLERTSAGCSLTGELGLNLGIDVNGDRHGRPHDNPTAAHLPKSKDMGRHRRQGVAPRGYRR